ncbi:hypothetical protein E8E11_000433 [Didymella keratinophila]|nr:hypothetical protein E8E11_000433 [Didymella keratinophila]
MTEPSNLAEEQPAEEFSCSSWDRSDPYQQEVSRILKDFKIDLMGVISIGADGVLRSLTADRTVIDAQGLTPDQIRAFELRVPPSHRMISNGVDGSKAERSTWYKPAEGILPAPMPRERLEESINMSEEQKDFLRQKMEDKPNWVDISGVLNT